MPNSGTQFLRSLADDLRQRSAAELTSLLSARPDLLTPVPADIRELALRAGSAHSVAQALDRLDALQLAVLEIASAIGGPTTEPEIQQAVAASAHSVQRDHQMSPEATAWLHTLTHQVSTALTSLWGLGLIWGRDELNVVRSVADAFGQYPCGLYSPLSAHNPQYRHWQERPDEVLAVLARCSASATSTLTSLAWRGPTAEVMRASRVKDEPGSPWGELVNARLLHVVHDSTLAVPREVALALRGGAWVEPERLHFQPAGGVMEITGRRIEVAVQAAMSIRALADFLAVFDSFFPKLARSAQIQRADMARLTQLASVSESVATCYIAMSLAAGLLGPAGNADEVLALTARGHEWLTWEPGVQWWELALTLNQDGGAVLASALSGVVDRNRLANAQTERCAVIMFEWLTFLAHSPDHLEPLIQSFFWHRPRLATHANELKRCVEICELIGLFPESASGALARAILTSDHDNAKALIDSTQPPEVRHFIVQSDHSIVVPGRPVPSVREVLKSICDVVSHDHALVLRVSTEKLRTYISSGHAASDIIEFFAQHAVDALPQSLTYLVNDCARPRAQTRITSPSAVISVSTSDEAARIASDVALRALKLERIDTLTFACQTSPQSVVTALQAQGYAVEAVSLNIEHNAILTSSAFIGRRSWSEVIGIASPGAVAQILLDGARPVENETFEGVPTEGWTVVVGHEIRAILEQHMTKGASLYIEIADAGTGSSRVQLVSPINLDAGFATVYDLADRKVHTVSLSRIMRFATR